MRDPTTSDWLEAYFAVSYLLDVPIVEAVARLSEPTRRLGVAARFASDEKERRAAAVARGLAPVVKWLEEGTLT